MTRVLWDYLDLLLINYPLAYVLALWLFLEGSMEPDHPGKRELGLCPSSFYSADLESWGCSGDFNPYLVGHSLLQPRETGSLHATPSSSLLSIG